jgi:menaquinone-9 beta-reductase
VYKRCVQTFTVVGGGPAGLTAAIALAARGHSVTVLERATYPRDKPCAGALSARGMKLLRALGCMPVVPQIAIDRATLQTPNVSRSSSPARLGCVIRRDVFDADLARLARTRNVRIEEGVQVRGLRELDSHVVLETNQGELRADFVIGADGVGSQARAALGNDRTFDAQVIEVDTPMLARESGRELVFQMREGFPGYSWVFPTPLDHGHGTHMATRGVYRLRGAPGPTLEEELERLLQSANLRSQDFRHKRFSERGLARGTRLSSKRIALIGEAAGIDAITGEGIAQAIEYGVLFADFVGAQRASLEPWHSTFARTRLGVDLRVRMRLLHSFFGKRQAIALRLLESQPSVVEVGARYFAGLPQPFASLVPAGLAVATEALRARFGVPGFND